MNLFCINVYNTPPWTTLCGLSSPIEMETSLSHKLEVRKSRTDLVKDANATKLVDLYLAKEPLELDLFSEYISSDNIKLKDILISIQARLHRSLAPCEFFKIATFLHRLLELEPHLTDFVLNMTVTFPHLMVVLSRLCLFQPSETADNFISEGLARWTTTKFFSNQYSQDELLRHLVSLLNHSIVRFSRGEPGTIQRIQGYCSKFIRSWKITSENLVNTLDMLISILSTLSLSRVPIDLDLTIAILEYIVDCKKMSPFHDCTILLECLPSLSCPYSPLFAVVMSHPMFNESETMASFKLVPTCREIDLFAHASALLSVADYPCLGKECDNMIKPIACAERYERCAINVDLCPVKNKLVLLACAAIESYGTTVDPSWLHERQDLDYLHIFFFISTLGLLTDDQSETHLKVLTNICLKEAKFVQRVLLLLPYALKTSPDPRILLTVVNALKSLTKVDDFSRIRALTMLDDLLKYTFEAKALILPLLALDIDLYPAVFILIKENLPSLLFEKDATSLGQDAYAVTIFRMSLSNSRQSFLNFAFASISAAIKPKSTIRDLSLANLAVLLDSVYELVKSRYIDPKLGIFSHISSYSWV